MIEYSYAFFNFVFHPWIRTGIMWVQFIFDEVANFLFLIARPSTYLFVSGWQIKNEYGLLVGTICQTEWPYILRG